MRAWFPVVLVCAGIFVASSIPGVRMPPLEVSSLDKLFHAAAYSLLGGSLARALTRCAWFVSAMTRATPGARRRAIALVIVAASLAALLYGASDEWHQSFVPGRHMSGLDLVADGVGALCGASVIALRRGRRWRSPTAAHRDA